MKLAIDFDGTILDLYNFENRWMEEHSNYKMVKPDAYELHERYGISKEECDRVIDGMFDEYREQNPLYPNAVNAIMTFQKNGAEVIFTTARDPKDCNKDLAFLVKSGLSSIPIRYCDQTNNKVIDIAMIRPTYLFEDRGEIALDNAVCGTKVCLIDTPYNRTYSHPNIIRIKDWYELEKFIVQKMDEEESS